jgi:hypothetical protein
MGGKTTGIVFILKKYTAGWHGKHLQQEGYFLVRFSYIVIYNSIPFVTESRHAKWACNSPKAKQNRSFKRRK